MLSKECQMMFFSATYDEEIMNFAEIIVQRPLIIRLKREEESLNNIKQYYVKCANQQEKYSAVTNIYGTVGVGQAIIFCHVSEILLCILISLQFFLLHSRQGELLIG